MVLHHIYGPLQLFALLCRGRGFCFTILLDESSTCSATVQITSMAFYSIPCRLYIASVMVVVQSSFRLAEYVGGQRDVLPQHEYDI